MITLQCQAECNCRFLNSKIRISLLCTFPPRFMGNNIENISDSRAEIETLFHFWLREIEVSIWIFLQIEGLVTKCGPCFKHDISSLPALIPFWNSILTDVFGKRLAKINDGCSGLMDRVDDRNIKTVNSSGWKPVSINSHNSSGSSNNQSTKNYDAGEMKEM